MRNLDPACATTRAGSRLHDRIVILAMAVALLISACSDDSSETTTAPTPTPTTTSTAPATTTQAPISVPIKIELAVAFEVTTSDTCSGTDLDGEDFGYLTAGGTVLLEDTNSGGLWSGELGAGSVTTNQYGLEVCTFGAIVENVPATLDSYSYRVDGDTRQIAGNGAGAHPDPLLYPHGVPNGLGYEIVDWQLYPSGLPIWYTDVFQTSLMLDGVIGAEDFLFGVGFALPTGSALRNPFEGGSMSFHVVHNAYASWYVVPEDGHRVREAYIGSAPHQFAQQGNPGVNDVGIWLLTTEDNFAVDFEIGGADVFMLDIGETFATAEPDREALQIVSAGPEVVLAFSAGGTGGYEYFNPPSEYVIFDYFPFLEEALGDPPQSKWDQGISLVTAPDCPDCDAIVTLLDAAPDGVPVHVLTLDDRIVRMFAITDVPYLVAMGPGQFDKMTAEAGEALDAVDDAIERVCGWLSTCG